MLRLTALALTVCLAFTPSAAGDCALIGLTAKVITKPNTELPSDGGIVVIAEPKQGGKLDPGDAAIVRSWRFKGSNAEPKFDSIAPGLAVIRLPVNASGRAMGGELVDGKTSLVVVKTTDTRRPALPAPQIKTITHVELLSRRISSQVTVTLDALPSGVVALVLADDKGKPRSFGMFGAPPVAAGGGMPSGPMPIDVFAQHQCRTQPNGTVPSKAGDTVTVMFVDDLGRVSPPSRPFKIAKATTP